MKVVFITSKPIFPSVDGGCFASQSFLRCLLNAEIDVSYLTLATQKHPFDRSKFPNELRAQINPDSVTIDTGVTALSALRHLFKKGSYNVNRFHDTEMSRLIRNTVEKSSPDAVIFDSLYTSTYLEELRSYFKGRIFVRTHNVEYQLWEDYTADAKGLKRMYMKRLTKDLRRYEIRALNAVDGIFSISTDDSNLLKSVGIQAPIYDVPVAVEIPDLKNDYEGNELYHLGSMDWEPNQQAVEQLINYLPALQRRVPDAKLHIAGANAFNYFQSDLSKKIYVHGFIEDINHFAMQHGILASPIISASGVRIKFLEAMAMGIPIVTTTAGALGIDVENTRCLVIADDPESFVDKCEELIRNKTLRQEIGANGINYIRKNHNIDDISRTIFEILGRT